MERNARKAGEKTTRERLVEAAARRFAQASYDHVGLRDIAADVGVDVAYAHRCFGSKEALFIEVLRVAGASHRFEHTPGTEILESLLGKLFRAPPPAGDGPDPFMIFIRSLAVPKASEPVAEGMQEVLIEPLRCTLRDSTAERATVIAALMVGLGIMRNVLQMPAMVSSDTQKTETLVRAALKALADTAHPPES